ncbi:hypothetical protein K438DRAFT_1758687 [Mycena galopus ATCC 62051]|nr:hypothetical protein K438DRAFT_1758687 [Mycena galopus ATCC 62051]
MQLQSFVRLALILAAFALSARTGPVVVGTCASVACKEVHGKLVCTKGADSPWYMPLLALLDGMPECDGGRRTGICRCRKCVNNSIVFVLGTYQTLVMLESPMPKSLDFKKTVHCAVVPQYRSAENSLRAATRARDGHGHRTNGFSTARRLKTARRVVE